uniref:C1q domain-containing protein n=1 Tax=Poecilia latipinna TaxID=48699 RepID=A0A3B3UX49_9TELE
KLVMTSLTFLSLPLMSPCHLPVKTIFILTVKVLITYFPCCNLMMFHFCLSAKRLAFSASFLALTPGNFGPFNTHTTLVFRHVVTNVGNAYNPHTGLFTAPVRGAYHFEFYIYGHGSSNPTSAVLVKNREQIFTAWTTQPEGGQKTSNGVTLLLNVGDVVFLRMWANSRIHDNPDRHNTFSGHLLFTM